MWRRCGRELTSTSNWAIAAVARKRLASRAMPSRISLYSLRSISEDALFRREHFALVILQFAGGEAFGVDEEFACARSRPEPNACWPS